MAAEPARPAVAEPRTAAELVRRSRPAAATTALPVRAAPTTTALPARVGVPEPAVPPRLEPGEQEAAAAPVALTTKGPVARQALPSWSRPTMGRPAHSMTAPVA
jgi:hypothetical protein